MLDPFLVHGEFQLILILFFLFVFVIQIIYYTLFYLKLAFYKESETGGKKEGVSVVICARNEYNQLKENLPLILEQEYPDFEVVVVNHASEDETSFLLAGMATQYPHLKIVEIKENLNFFDGKKFPLSIGIKSAANDIILLTDADCKPVSRNWIELMASGFTGNKEIVIGYGAYAKRSGLLNRIIRFNTVQIALQYLSFALSGIPYMGVGRNMAYRKSLFYEQKGFTSHYDILSGDDDLFINRSASKKNTQIVIIPDSFTISEPKKKVKEWWAQKKRHLSTGRYYKLKHKLLLGLYAFSLIFFYLSFALLLVLQYNFFIVLALFIIRMALQLFIYKRILNRLNEKGIWFFVPFFEIFMILINFVLSISTLVTKESKWK